MSVPFDPYRKWLGIPPKEQPPHHYRLLGIAAFEEDPDVIDNAASRQMAHLKTFKASKYAAESQRLLGEISIAKLCLLSPDSKAKYDAELRQRLAATGKLSSSQVVPPPPPADADETDAEVEPEFPPMPRAGSRWREEGQLDPMAAVPVPLPVPVPIPLPPAAAALPPAVFVPAPVFTGLPPLSAPPIPGPPLAAAPPASFAPQIAAAAPDVVPKLRHSSAASLVRARRKRAALPTVVTVVSLVVLAVAGGLAAIVANLPNGEPGSSSTEVQPQPAAPPPAGEKTKTTPTAPHGTSPAESREMGVSFPVAKVGEFARQPLTSLHQAPR
jgi:hypothetical protein